MAIFGYPIKSDPQNQTKLQNDFKSLPPLASVCLFGEICVICGLVPDPNDKVKENCDGAFYVDSSCIDCDVCRETAPENFTRSFQRAYSYVSRQPENETEHAACEEALACCPVEAIGNDGEVVPISRWERGKG